MAEVLTGIATGVLAEAVWDAIKKFWEKKKNRKDSGKYTGTLERVLEPAISNVSKTLNTQGKTPPSNIEQTLKEAFSDPAKLLSSPAIHKEEFMKRLSGTDIPEDIKGKIFDDVEAAFLKSLYEDAVKNDDEFRKTVVSNINEILSRQNKSAATENQILNALNSFAEKDENWRQLLDTRLERGFREIDDKLNVIVGKIDSLTVGSNVQYIDCSVPKPDGTTSKASSHCYAQGMRPITDPKSVFGRQQELERIDEILKTSSSLAITGFRGTGKSTLASMYIDRIEKSCAYAGIYWRRMDETNDIGDVVGSFFTVIGKPIEKLRDYKSRDLLALLFQELEKSPYFLVFDNFEVLINPKTNEFLNPDFSELIEKSNEIGGKSRVLFTCWECPASERGIKPEWYPIGGLDQQASARLLEKMGLVAGQNELTKVIERSGGHPLALKLLAQLVKGESGNSFRSFGR